MRICLVDDNDAVLDALALWLGDEGNEISLARSGAEAVLHMRQAQPDLVISDVNLSDTTGVALAREIRSRWPHIVIVLMSGQAQLPPGAIAADGADVFLMKPFTPKLLIDAVSRAQTMRAAA